MVLLPVRYTIRSFDSDLDIRFGNGLSQCARNYFGDERMGVDGVDVELGL